VGLSRARRETHFDTVLVRLLHLAASDSDGTVLTDWPRASGWSFTYISCL